MSMFSKFWAMFGFKSASNVSIVNQPIAETVIETVPETVIETVIETVPETITETECDISVYLLAAIEFDNDNKEFDYANNPIVHLYRACVMAKMARNMASFRKLVDSLVRKVQAPVTESTSGAGSSHVKKGSVNKSPSERVTTAINNDSKGNHTWNNDHKAIRNNGQDIISSTHAVDCLFDGIWEFEEDSKRQQRVNLDNNPYITNSPSYKAWESNAKDASILGFLAQYARNHASEDNLHNRRGDDASKGYKKKRDCYAVDIADSTTMTIEDNDTNYWVKGIAGDIGAMLEDHEDKMSIAGMIRQLDGGETSPAFFKEWGQSKSSGYRKMKELKNKINDVLISYKDNEEVTLDIMAMAIRVALEWNR